MPKFSVSNQHLNGVEFNYFISVITQKNIKQHLSSNHITLLALLAYLEEKNDFLDFIEAFAGKTIKIPSQRYITLICNNAKICDYYLRNGTESTIEKFSIDEDRLTKILKAVEAEVSDE